MYGRHGSMVCLSRPTTKCRQDGNHLDRAEGQPEQAEVTAIGDEIVIPVDVVWNLGVFFRLWIVHETIHHESCQHLFLPLMSPMASASPCRKRHHHPSGNGSHHVKTGLLQLGVGRPSQSTFQPLQQSRMPHGSPATFHVTNTSLLICASCTGFRFTQESSTSCAWWCTTCTMVAALHICPTWCSLQMHHYVHSSAFCRFVKLRQAATSDKIRRTCVFIFWSSSKESTPRSH